MTEIMPIPAASVAGMIFSLILSFALPIGLLVFLPAENEATQDARMLPVEECKSALLEF